MVSRTFSMFLPCVLACLQSAPGQTLEERWSAHVSATIAQGEQLASWCKEERLFQSWHATYAAILVLDPDHEEARKTLKYKRDKNGEWQRKSTREPRNRNEKALPEYERRKQAWYAQYVDGAHALYESSEAPEEAAARGRILAAILQVAPDDARARAALGEVRHQGRWILAESGRALVRREKIHALARSAIEAIGSPKPLEIPASLKKSSLPFTHAAQHEALKVITTHPLEETRRATVLAGASWKFTAALFDLDTSALELQVYLLAGLEQARTLWREYEGPKFDLNEKVSGDWVSATELVGWSDTPEKRFDGVTRQVIGRRFSSSFGIWIKNGWIFEGMGFYLAERICGTRLTWFASPDRYASNKPSKARDLESQWMLLGLARLEERGPQILLHTMRRDIAAMTDDHVVVAYVLAAYFLEAHPKKVPKLLRASAKAKDRAQPVLDAVGMELEAFHAHLVRWLKETV